MDMFLKKSVIIGMLIMVCSTVNAQTSLLWNPSYLTIDDINNYGYTLNNSSDNTIKIELYDSSRLIGSYIVHRQRGVPINYNTLLSQKTIRDITIKVSYDLECYNYDLQTLNDFARQRLDRAEKERLWKSIFSIIGTSLEQIGNDEWQTIGKLTNSIVNVSNFSDDFNKEGLSVAVINQINMQIQDKITDNLLKNKYANTIVKSLQVLHNNYGQSLNIDIKDLEEKAFYLASCISNSPLYTYSINYDKTIAPVIDYDRDGILNFFDECPDSFGLAEYNGCTKDEYKAKNREVRNSVVKSFWIDFGYSHSKLGNLDFQTSNFQADLSKSTFYLNTTIPIFKHKFSNRVFGTFGIDANYFVGNIKTPKIKFTTSTETGKVVDKFTDQVEIKEHTIFTGFSYSLITKWKNRSVNTIIQPKFGVLAYSNLVDDVYEQRKLYADLTLRLDYFSAGWFLGIRYQQNPYYSFNFHGNIFVIPQNNINYYLGLYFRF